MSEITEKKKSYLPLKPIKKILAHHCPYQISHDAVYSVESYVEDFINLIGTLSVKRFEELNEARESQGLEPLKRLNAWSVDEAVATFLRAVEIMVGGSESILILNPGGQEMKNKKDATKSAKKDDSIEVQ